jgi:hypothetical protein
LLCALGFKAVDAMLAPSVEQNQENLKMLLERVDQYEEQKTGQTDEIAEMQDEP